MNDLWTAFISIWPVMLFMLVVTVWAYYADKKDSDGRS
jgi:hypothetical protein